MNAPVNAGGPRLRPALALLIALAAALCAPRPATAEVQVTASIPPLHSLVAQVMSGAGSPRLLIPGGTSPHGFALSPSQARMLAEAEIVFWVGGGLETGLAKPIGTLAKNARVVALSRAPGLVRLPVRHLGDEGHDHGHGHDHGAGADDPHYWLDPVNAKAMIAAIAEALVAADPARKDLYVRNASAARNGIDALTADFQARLAPLKDRPFIVFHDAYQYLERRFGLVAQGILAIDPDRPAGARHIADLRARMTRLNVVCLFMEPQFPSRLATALIEGTQARIGILDPLGSDLTPGPDLYGAMMTANLRAFEGCLGGKP
ncbi:MAG: zinc ABC transporter substrate-binding protein [Rhodospirillaceae bacterium]|nr:zinc ABC transporter substrate-binding protein [Magnetovibrio sp.]MAY68822.1 zinc ABC transporter substrate-binding protein [Rhodospirillaceae bacterium]